MSSLSKSKHRTNPTTRALRTPTFRQRKIRPKKGRGSYSRDSRNSRAASQDFSTAVGSLYGDADVAVRYSFCLQYVSCLLKDHSCWVCGRALSSMRAVYPFY